MSEILTLLDILDAAAGERTAIVLPDTGLSVDYADLRRRVRAMAGALHAAGVRRGDRVAMALPNGLDAIVAFLAAAAAGTAAPLNPGYKYEEFCFYLADTQARMLIVPRDEGTDARRAAEQSGIPILTPGVSGDRAEPNPQPDDIALVLHTSGSTGRPKRVPLRHRNLAASTRTIAETYALGPSDVSLCLMPLFHVHGLMASTMATLLTGGTVVVPAKFNALMFWRLVRDYGVTWFSAVPTMHQLILTRKRSGDERLRFVRSCSAALPPDLMHRMEDYFAAPVLEAYGMTEASHQMASNPLPPAARKAGSVGPPTGLRISIRDGQGGELPRGVAGEVCIDGPGVIRAYENNPEATAKSFFGEWFRTGDQGILDADGYLHLDRAHQGADHPRRVRISRRARSMKCCWRIRPWRRRCASACRIPRGAKRWKRRLYCGRRRRRRKLSWSRSAAVGWRISNARRRFTLLARFRAPLPARSSG